MAAASGGAQKLVIHGLIDQSRERVVQVRAGQSLVDVLTAASPSHSHGKHHHHHQHQQNHNRAQRHEADRPPHPSRSEDGVMLSDMTLVYEARRRDAGATTSKGDATAMHKNLRKRGIMGSTPTPTAAGSTPPPSPVSREQQLSSTAPYYPRRLEALQELLPAEQVSSAKYRAYVDSKSLQVETLHANDRRKAIAKSALRMAQLVATAAQQEIRESPLQNATIAASVTRTLAVLKARNVLLRPKHHFPDVQELVSRKNPHFAFLDFKKASDEHDSGHKHTRAYALQCLFDWLAR